MWVCYIYRMSSRRNPCNHPAHADGFHVHDISNIFREGRGRRDQVLLAGRSVRREKSCSGWAVTSGALSASSPPGFVSLLPKADSLAPVRSGRRAVAGSRRFRSDERIGDEGTTAPFCDLARRAAAAYLYVGIGTVTVSRLLIRVAHGTSLHATYVLC